MDFSHWRTAESSSKVSELHTMKTHMEFQSGDPLTPQCKGLKLILQNISGNIKIEKQRAVLLIKADFYFGKKLYFGSRMIKRAMGHGLVPLEQHGIRNQNCLEMGLTKTFFNDIMRQKPWAVAKG